jgi:hypothetical protein
MSGLIRIAQQERERRKNNNTQWDQHEPIVRKELSTPRLARMKSKPLAVNELK